MRFSVALTTYQSEPYLGVQLHSLLTQSLSPFELVVCDDGSTDRTLELLAEFSAAAPFPVRIFRNEKNLGYALNFTQAISLCEGDWIFLCDHDDRWHPEKLACFAEKIGSDPELCGLFSDSVLVDSHLRPLGATLFEANRFHQFERKFIRDGEAWRTFLRHNVVAGHALGFRTSLRPKILPVPNGWVHDAWIASRLARLGKIDFIEKPLVDYRQHERQNIGVLAGSPLARLRARWNRSGRRADLALEAERWRLLALAPEWQAPAAVREELARKIRWLEGRAGMPRAHLLRLPFLLGNFRLYFRLDNGWQTILKDLLLR